MTLRRFRLSVQEGVRYLLDGAPVERQPAEAKGPTWNKLFPLGKTKFRSDFPKGGITFDAPFLSAMVANFKRLQAQHTAGSFGLPVDYHHRGSSDPSDATPQAEKVASGWIEDVQLRDDGLWVAIRWTDKAREHIARDEYRYLSPEFATQWRDADTGKPQGPTLLGAALLNDPFLKELPRVAASDTPSPQAGTPAAQGAPNMEWLKAMLGLPPEATEEQCKAKLQEVLGGQQASAQAVAATAAKLSTLEAGALKLADANKELVARLAALEQEKREVSADVALEKLQAEGKILPVQKPSLKALALSAGVDAVLAIYKDAPAVVKLGEVGVPGKTHQESKEEALKKLSVLMDEYQDKHKLTALQAQARARAEHPELVKAARG